MIGSPPPNGKALQTPRFRQAFGVGFHLRKRFRVVNQDGCEGLSGIPNVQLDVQAYMGIRQLIIIDFSFSTLVGTMFRRTL